MDNFEMTSAEPKTVFLPNGEEWTLDEPLVQKTDGVFDFAEEGDTVVAHLIGRRVLRFGSAHLAAFHKAETDYEAYRAKWNDWHDYLFWIGILSGILLAFLSWFVMSEHLHVNFDEGWPVVVPLMVFIGTLMFFVTHISGWHFNRRNRKRDEAKSFRQAIIHVNYPDIALADIGRYVLLTSDKVEDIDPEVDHQTA